MSKPRDDWQKDLVRAPLDEIIDLEHPMARLGREIDWNFLDGRFRSVSGASMLTSAAQQGAKLGGHNHPHKFKVWISGQLRRVTQAIRREMRRRAAVEAAIGHIKAEHRTERNYLNGREGDGANAVLATAGYNFALLLKWFEALLRALIQVLLRAVLFAQAA